MDCTLPLHAFKPQTVVFVIGHEPELAATGLHPLENAASPGVHQPIRQQEDEQHSRSHCK